MVEGRLAGHELIRQHANTPQINRLVVLLALQDLRGHVVTRPAIGLPPLFVAEGRPPEICQLAHVLFNKQNCTLVMMMFYGLMSLWAMPRSWRYFIDSAR